jgi:hypothetical protein
MLSSSCEAGLGSWRVLLLLVVVVVFGGVGSGRGDGGGVVTGLGLGLGLGALGVPLLGSLLLPLLLLGRVSSVGGAPSAAAVAAAVDAVAAGVGLSGGWLLC